MYWLPAPLLPSTDLVSSQVFHAPPIRVTATVLVGQDCNETCQHLLTLSVLPALSHLTFTINKRGKYYYFEHFTEETEVQQVQLIAQDHIGKNQQWMVFNPLLATHVLIYWVSCTWMAAHDPAVKNWDPFQLFPLGLRSQAGWRLFNTQGQLRIYLSLLSPFHSVWLNAFALERENEMNVSLTEYWIQIS